MNKVIPVLLFGTFLVGMTTLILLIVYKSSEPNLRNQEAILVNQEAIKALEFLILDNQKRILGDLEHEQ